MADPTIIDHWLLPEIVAPAAGDKIGISTGPLAGGGSRRDAFMYRDAAGVFQANGPARIRYSPDDKRAKMIVNNMDDGSIAVPAYSEVQLRGGSADTVIGTLSAYNCFTNTNETGLSISLRNDAGGFGERARFTGNGHFGVGVSPIVRAHFKSSAEILRLETTTPRGGGANYMALHDPSGRQGYFGYGGAGSDITIMNELAGAIRLGTASTFRWQIGSAALEPSTDNVQSLGYVTNRVTVVYAVTGTINTCDEREKTWREMFGIDVSLYAPNLYEAELRAALRTIDELGFFQWNDAIADPAKGPEGARWHFGPRAQRVWAIFADEGLCLPLIQRAPGGDLLPPEGSIPPAFLCFDEWGEETAPVLAWWKPSAILGPDGEPVMVLCAEGEEGTEQRPTGETIVTRPAGNRFGVRIDQLHSLMIAALNAERLAQATTIAGMEARLVALEAAA